MDKLAKIPFYKKGFPHKPIDMRRLVRELRAQGTTIILSTHYIEEAEDMADRIGVINKGELIVVEDKEVLMRKLGKTAAHPHFATAHVQHPGWTQRLVVNALRRRTRPDL